jgi:hypothetical protein
MNYPTSEVLNAGCERSPAGGDFSKVSRAMQESVMRRIFKKFDALGGHRAENITKIED